MIQQFHPVVAVGKLMVPVVPGLVPPTPIRHAAAVDPAVTLAAGLEPAKLLIVGAVALRVMTPFSCTEVVALTAGETSEVPK